ncbi:hypothetical protein PAPHI01_2136 [Pancytospora philotis]|nr:hypothetical protein PAPHI01_2136 [Pancytospora philotis]
MHCTRHSAWHKEKTTYQAPLCGHTRVLHYLSDCKAQGCYFSALVAPATLKTRFCAPSCRMIDMYGITEIVGEPAVGKTALVLAACRKMRTLYISPSILCHRHVGAGFLIYRVDSLFKLNVFFARSGLHTVRMFAIDCIVIDGLDQYLYTEPQPRRLSSEVFRLAKMLKALAFGHGVAVVITNGFYSGWKIDSCTIYNRYLGLRWSYVANTRYRITRDSGGTRRIEQTLGGECAPLYFKIADDGITAVEHDERVQPSPTSWGLP